MSFILAAILNIYINYLCYKEIDLLPAGETGSFGEVEEEVMVFSSSCTILLGDGLVLGETKRAVAEKTLIVVAIMKANIVGERAPSLFMNIDISFFIN